MNKLKNILIQLRGCDLPIVSKCNESTKRKLMIEGLGMIPSFISVFFSVFYICNVISQNTLISVTSALLFGMQYYMIFKSTLDKTWKTLIAPIILLIALGYFISDALIMTLFADSSVAETSLSQVSFFLLFSFVSISPFVKSAALRYYNEVAEILRSEAIELED